MGARRIVARRCNREDREGRALNPAAPPRKTTSSARRSHPRRLVPEGMRIARFAVANELRAGRRRRAKKPCASSPATPSTRASNRPARPTPSIRCVCSPRSSPLQGDWSDRKLGWNRSAASPQFFLINTTVIGPGDPVTLPSTPVRQREGELASLSVVSPSVPLERVHEVIFGHRSQRPPPPRPARRPPVDPRQGLRRRHPARPLDRNRPGHRLAEHHHLG